MMSYGGGPEVPLDTVQPSCINAERISVAAKHGTASPSPSPNRAAWAFTDDVRRRQSPTTASGPSLPTKHARPTIDADAAF